jgi:proteic killer suppression protein
MEVTFKSNKLEKSITTNSGLMKTYGKALAKKVKLRYEQLLANETLADMKTIRAARLHSLSGDRAGQWAVDVSGNERMCFILICDPIPLLPDGGINLTQITDVEIVFVGDYH